MKRFVGLARTIAACAFGLVAIALVAIAPAVALAQLKKPGDVVPEVKYSDPWFGTWVSGQDELTMTPWEDGIKLVEHHPTPDGKVTKVVAFGRLDGLVYRETGVGDGDGLTFVRVDDRTYEYIGSKDAQITSRVTVTFPLDGITRISHVTLSNGKPADRTRIWRRKQVPGPDPWYGTWQTSNATSNTTFIMEPWEDGFLVSFTRVPTSPNGKLQHGSVFGRFDDRKYRETGSDGTDYVVFKKIDARTIALVHYKGEKETTTVTMTFAPDGKSRVSKTTGVEADGTKVDRSVTWTRVEQQPEAHAQTKPAIIGYVFPQDKVINPADITATKLTHINYAFADVKDGRVVEGFARDAENFKILTGLRRVNPALKILISVGGWTWSGRFSDAALTDESRRRFSASAVEFVRRHDIDGVDIDWEYPAMPGFEGNVVRPEDKQNFTHLMAELRRALDEEGRAKGGRYYLLTFAAGGYKEFADHTEMDKVQAYIDFANLMTYDFRGNGDPSTGHHSNLYTHPADVKQRSVDRAVKDFIAAGVPAKKIVVGVPFYGKGWGSVTGDGTGLYQPGSRLTERIETRYGGLVENVIGKNGFVRMWDKQSQAPYLWNKEKGVFIGYDDPESLRLKSRYILDQGLGGVMFWEYYGDRSGALLDALHTTLHGAAPATR